jgi:hypothetical protein
VRSYDSDLSGSLPSPSSFGELFPLLHEPHKHWMVRMWRGQGDIDWPIHSTAYRRLAGDASHAVIERHVQSYEKGLLERAEHRGFRLHEGRELSDFELLARLRHHGAATRFIDGTRNALIGLWFCISNQKDKVGLLVGVHCTYLRGYEGQPEKRSYDEIFNDKEFTNKPYTWEPPRVTLRVAAQHSHFVYSPIVSDRMGGLALPNEGDATLLIAILPSLKKTCAEILEQVYDIRRETLFPDLDGFGVANGVAFSEESSYRW